MTSGGSAMSWKMVVIMASGERASNACRYATQQEARDAGIELLSRWFAPIGSDTEPSDEPVNYRFANGRSERIEGVA